jgi:hypothetical protein
MQKLLLVLIFSAVATFSANIVAVLEITPNSENVDLELSEYRHLTDELRTRARETLPRSYSILTRDNIIQLLPPDEKEAECLAEGCAVDIGRAIGAEYVTQGFVGYFAGMLTLTDIDSNKLYKDYEKKSIRDPEKMQALRENQELYKAYVSERSNKLKESNDAGALGNVGYAVGGALLTAGTAVHIWF